MLRIADKLNLPLDTVTQTIGLLAKRRAGKSYTMRRILEQLLDAKLQVVLVDPKGDQWGIRYAADGKGPGYPVFILGGERGHIPLEVQSGELVAKLVVEERVNVVLDLSLFRKHEVATFMTAFMENLYRLKAKEQYRTPVMLAIDEADAIAPQKPQKGQERMLGAAEDIVRRGGQRGIGCLLVTQRAAVLNKNVLTQCQILVALRTIAPQDLDAMKAWIDVHGTLEQQKTLMESLPSLPVGDAWFWSPGWPEAEGIFQRVHVHAIKTFDSGATPKPGEKRIEPKKPAEVDLDALRKQMAATIEKAKQENPTLLKRRVAELEAQLRKAGTVAPATTHTPPPNPKEIARIKHQYDRELMKYYKQIEQILNKMRMQVKTTAEFFQGINILPPQIDNMIIEVPPAVSRMTPAVVLRPTFVTPKREDEANGERTGVEKRILDTMAMLKVREIKATRDSIARWMGIHPAGGRYIKSLASLRASGEIDGWELRIGWPMEQETGIEGALAALPEEQMRRVLRAIVAASTPLSKEELAERLEIHPAGGRFIKTLAWFRDMGIIPERGQIHPTEGLLR